MSERLDRIELRHIGEALLAGDAAAIEAAVAFVVGDSRGVGHGRARARFARRLKHVALSSSQETRLVESIVHRLHSGAFAEQFDDEWRLALHLDAAATTAAAAAALASPHRWVRAVAARVLRAHGQRTLSTSRPAR